MLQTCFLWYNLNLTRTTPFSPDIFNASKGGAVIKADDSDADEELGGASQILEVQTKMAVEALDSDDDEDDDGPTPPDYNPNGFIDDEAEEEDVKPRVKAEKSSATAAASAPSHVKSEPKAGGSGGKSNTADSTPNSMDGPRTQPRTQEQDDSDDDKTASLAPEPVKSSAVGGAKDDSAGKGEGKAGPGSDKPDKDTPDRSQSSVSPDGPTTQPATQPPSQKKGAVCLMGTVFGASTQKKKKDQPAKKKGGGLYIPSYAKK